MGIRLCYPALLQRDDLSAAQRLQGARPALKLIEHCGGSRDLVLARLEDTEVLELGDEGEADLGAFDSGR